MSNSFNRRYFDVLTALYEAKNYEQSIGRIQLQKYIYLVDTISLVWDVLAPKNGHETYKHGPFDDAINNAADVLAFRGFVKVLTISIDEKRVDVQYEITADGIELFQRLSQNSIFHNKMQVYSAVAKQVQRRGWKKLRQFVYAEPTYAHTKSTGWGFKFDHTSLFHNESLRIITDFEKMLEKGKSLSKENMVSLFFKILE